MFSKPQREHKWLEQFVGRWKFEQDCHMPDGKEVKTYGTMDCRMLGGMWLICESSGEAPDGGKWSSIMTVGFDPAQNQYVGTFVGSMMANIWPYKGVLDAAGKRLPLDSVGPKLDGTGHADYRDTIEVIDADTWLFISELKSEDGSWLPLMKGKHTRN